MFEERKHMTYFLSPCFIQNAHGHAVRYPAHQEATFSSVLVCSQKATVKFQFLAYFNTLTSNQIGIEKIVKYWR